MVAGAFAGTAEHLVMYPVDSVKVSTAEHLRMYLVDSVKISIQNKRYIPSR